jgi:23S rRNA pseudouridine2605 synthase
VDGKLLQGAQNHVYLLLNKPKGYVTTVSDPEKRPTVMQLIRGVKKRVYPVGRLDYASEGLSALDQRRRAREQVDESGVARFRRRMW